MRALLAETFAVVRQQVAAIPVERYDDACVLDGWSVRDLAAHLARGLDAVVAVEPAGRQAPMTLTDYLSSYPGGAEHISTVTRELADELGDALLQGLDGAWSAAQQRLDELGDADQVVLARRGPIRLGDLLASRVLELVVHADDLARSVPHLPAPRLPVDATRLCVRDLLDALAERSPGRAVEVRVPPYAAVQCVAGPTHTRGTPANVVETDATTWIRLACGRTSWAEEVASHRVTASGARADLGELLPLL